MKRLMMACLLAASSHGWAADLNPECYELYDQFLAADWINAGRVAGEMHDRQCWPALQGIPDGQHAAQPIITSCSDLAPHIMRMVNADQTELLQLYDPKPMTYATIDRVVEAQPIVSYIDNRGYPVRVQHPLKHNDKIYVPGKGYYKDVWKHGGRGMIATPGANAPTYGDKGAVLVPNSEPFAGNPASGSRRILDCSAEGRYTFGMWLIQMYLDRDPGGQEFVGMAGLIELR